MLVAHVLHSFGIGGLESGVVNLVNTPRNGQRHAVICMTSSGASRANIRSDVDVFELHKADGHDVHTLVRLIGLLRRLRPTLVHTRNWGAFDGILAASLAGVPKVVHGEHGRDIADPDGRNRRRRWLRRLSARLVDRFTTVSDDLRRWLIEDVGIDPAKIVRIHNGVDTERYSPGDQGATRARLGIPIGRPVVGTVGRLDPVKDQARLIEACARLRETQTTLIIAGDGPCRQNLRSQATALGLEDHVLFLGERHDVPDVLRALDVFILPSIAEGISNTILEAMATGLPVVATRVGGNPELVTDGVTGQLVPRQETEALAKAIAAYLADPVLRFTHGAQGRARAVNAFGLATMRDAYANLYDELGGAQPARSMQARSEKYRSNASEANRSTNEQIC